MHGTTILAVRRNGRTAIGGDGQVTFGTAVLKGTAVKIRRLQEGKVVAGFAGAVADALTLFDRFEAKLREFNNLKRSAVELAKDWRSDRYLRRLEAMLLAADNESLLLVSGTGEVLEPDPWPPIEGQGQRAEGPGEELVAIPQPGYDTCIAVGSGGNFALSAARALLQATGLSAREIVQQSMSIAADLCIYTNRHVSIEEVGA